eukprot:jgi/Psemu1/183904/e_gw1.35.71.1
MTITIRALFLQRALVRVLVLVLALAWLVVVSESLVVAGATKATTSATISDASASTSTSRYTFRSETWDYRSKHDIGYEVATTTATTTTTTTEPILLLNGFGVGSFHQHRLVETLLNPNPSENENVHPNAKPPNEDDKTETERTLPPITTVYCLDYLGQGRSWPRDCRDGMGGNENGLQYSANTWCEQVIDFLDTIVIPSWQQQQQEQNQDDNNDNNTHKQQQQRCKVHLVGNSVGGHLAAHVALRRPDLVASLCLLNPTPVWGSKLPGWNGYLPAPPIPKAIGRYLFDRIRDLTTIDKFLGSVYSGSAAYSDSPPLSLPHKIRAATLGDGGHAAFASILWSPPLVVDTDTDSNSSSDFGDCLKSLPASLDVCLIFGADDPWCKPAFAVNMLRALAERQHAHAVEHERDPATAASPRTAQQQQQQQQQQSPPIHRYIQISNAGHCPNHEAPKAVAHVIRAWTRARDRRTVALPLAGNDDDGDGKKTFVEEWSNGNGETHRQTQTLHELEAEEIPRSLVDRIVARFL